MRRRFVLVALALAPAAAWGQAGQEPAGPQPELPKEQITIVTHDGQRHVFNVEMARAPQQQITGLMFRKSVPADGGMLFVWPAPEISHMWMKNTLAPLDMVFIRADGVIDSIAENTVPHSLRDISSQGPVIATLELQGGVTARLGITVGDRVLAPMFHDVG
jgi:uncharacterized membrane protein (UPF0127 family)